METEGEVIVASFRFEGDTSRTKRLTIPAVPRVGETVFDDDGTPFRVFAVSWEFNPDSQHRFTVQIRCEPQP
jgi:hypothetical protein